MEHQRVLFVCLGNICRSPTAEGIFREKVKRADLNELFTIDSAGTGSWHVGASPDARMQEAAQSQGYRLGGRARAVKPADFEQFDHILAMDRENLKDLKDKSPAKHHPKIRLFRQYDDEGSDPDVPDPYYGGEQGFLEVVSIVQRCADRFLASLHS